MAVKIRLKRVGSHKRPVYKIVVADSRFPRDGRFIEEIGTYNPILKENKSKINLESVEKWISCGAQPTKTVSSIIRKSKALVGVSPNNI